MYSKIRLFGTRCGGDPVRGLEEYRDVGPFWGCGEDGVGDGFGVFTVRAGWSPRLGLLRLGRAGRVRIRAGRGLGYGFVHLKRVGVVEVVKVGKCR